MLLNLEPDHLDRHGTLEAYRDAKLRIFENQAPDDVAVVPRGFGEIPGGARRVEFSADDDLAGRAAHSRRAQPRERSRCRRRCSRGRTPDDAQIAQALREFPGVPHRLEEVAEIRGVRFVNDSKATNAAAARRAIASFEEPLHVILGGLGKNESYDGLAADLRARGARAYLIGAAAGELAAADRARTSVCGDLATAVRAARPRPPSRATSCCSRPHAPATTSSRTSSNGATSSAGSSRSVR